LRINGVDFKEVQDIIEVVCEFLNTGVLNVDEAKDLLVFTKSVVLSGLV
jgi:hypothetical protein